MSRAQLAAYVVACAAAPVVGGASASAVVGGRSIPVESAPWAVFVQDTSGFCSGSILDAFHVLTAGHCVIDTSTGLADSPSQLTVTAGVSNFRHPRSSDAKQTRRASSVTVFPEYVWSTGDLELDAGSDIAVVRLAQPLDLGGPDARPISLAPPSASIATGSSVADAGFGAETAGVSPTGALELMHAKLTHSARCSTRVICASSPISSVCSGDSGSGLVSTGAVPVLVGVAVASSCVPGTQDGFVNVRAPDVRLFILGALGKAPAWEPAATRWVPSNWVSYPYGRLSLSLPHLWDVDGADFSDNPFSPQTTATEVVSSATAASTADYYRFALAQVLRQLDKLDPSAGLKTRLVSLPAGEAMELTSTYRYRRGGRLYFASLQSYLLVHDGEGYDVAYFCPLSQDSVDLAIFDESARTIHFVALRRHRGS